MLHPNRTDKDKPTVIFLEWCLEDIESRALEMEESEDDDYVEEFNEQGNTINAPKPLYDRTKFTDVLSLLDARHDCNYGVTWETIDHALWAYARLNENQPEPLFENSDE